MRSSPRKHATILWCQIGNRPLPFLKQSTICLVFLKPTECKRKRTRVGEEVVWFRPWRHMWVEFVATLLCTEKFFSPGWRVLPLPKNRNLIWLVGIWFAFVIFGHLADVLVLSTTWNILFYSCVDDLSISWQMFNFVFLFLKRWFQFNSRIVRTNFASVMTLNNWQMIAETRSHIFRWRSRFRRRRVCLSSLISRHLDLKE